MSTNITCAIVNGTSTCPNTGAGLSVGLSLFFLLLLIAAGVFVFKYLYKKRNVLHFGRRKSQNKEDDYIETPQTEPHQYEIREAPAGPNPIYENLTNNRRSTDKHRSLGDPDEGLYLECDLPDDVIYSNDPGCHLDLLSDGQDEDVYVVPDSS